MTTQSVLSTKYVQVPVYPQLPGYDPRGDVVKLAFMAKPPDLNPDDGDWHVGSWYSPTPGFFIAQVLVGPANGGVPLTEGKYTVWVQVVDNPEVPTEPVGELDVSP